MRLRGRKIQAPKTGKTSGDDELSEIMQYLQGQENIIAQLQMIQDTHEKQPREEQSEKLQPGLSYLEPEELEGSEKLKPGLSYLEPEELEGGPRENQTLRGTAPQALQVDQASPARAQAKMIWTVDSNDGPKQGELHTSQECQHV
jgi:hypothetical protein